MKVNKFFQLSLASLFFVFISIISSSVSAQPGGNFIDDFDTDSDGLVSQGEFPGPDDHFNELDADENGYIDTDETPTGPPPRGKDRPNPDTNQDGVVSQDEFPGPDDHFAELDINDDGFIDQSEKPSGPPEAGHGNGGSGRGPGGGGPRGDR